MHSHSHLCGFALMTADTAYYFQAPPPDTDKIPVADAVGVTVVLLTCSYRNREFIRVGYYVNNDYPDAEMRENPPAVPNFSLVSLHSLWLCETS